MIYVTGIEKQEQPPGSAAISEHRPEARVVWIEITTDELLEEGIALGAWIGALRQQLAEQWSQCVTDVLGGQSGSLWRSIGDWAECQLNTFRQSAAGYRRYQPAPAANRVWLTI